MKFHHPRGITRRSLLGNGIIQFSALSLLPSLFGSLSRKALGADGASLDWIPAVIIDLAGGAALPSHFLVGGKGGPTDFLPDYKLLGWDPRANNALFEGFGLPLATDGSFLQGLSQVSSAEARSRLRFTSFCHQADSDSPANLLSAFHLISRAGAIGNTIKRGTGARNSPSGGNSRAALSDAAYNATFIGSVSELQSLTQLNGALGLLGPSARTGLLNRLARMSEEQARNFSTSEDAEKLTEAVRRADSETVQSLSKVANLDARLDANAAAVFQLNAQTPPNAENAVFASLVLATLNRESGPTVLTMGGYDYHQGNEQAIAAKDREAGVLVGRVLELAHRLKRPVFMQLITDGGCSISANALGRRNWASDSNVQTMTLNAFYQPTGAVESVRQQVGHYTPGQGIDPETYVGRSAERVAALSFANYLSLSGRLGELANFVPGSLVDPGLLRDPRGADYPLHWGG